MYSNLGTKRIRNKVNEKIEINENENKNKFIPDTNKRVNQIEIINKVWPKSGWDKSKIIVGNKIMVLKRYFKYRFFFSIEIINDITITKKGFKISIGWNLGNDPISNHLFDPLTSTPIIGTKNKVINVMKNNIIDNLNKIFWSIKEKTKIKNIPKPTKTKCFKKK